MGVEWSGVDYDGILKRARRSCGRGGRGDAEAFV